MAIKTKDGSKMSNPQYPPTKIYMLRGGYGGDGEVRFYHDTVLNKVMIHQVSFGTLNESFTVVPTNGIFASSALTIGSDIWYDISVGEAVWNAFVNHKPTDHETNGSWKPWVRIEP